MSADDKPRILKFGGTSVGTAETLASACGIAKASAHERRTVVVVSALSGVTSALIDAVRGALRGETSHRALVPHLLRRHGALLEATGTGPGSAAATRALHRRVARLAELLEEATRRRACPPDAQAEVLGVGERLAVPVCVAALRAAGLAAEEVDAGRLIRTDTGFPEAAVDFPASRRLIAGWWARQPPGVLPVVPGFLGATDGGRTTLLGRGGSDYTAAILGHSLGAERVEIWTDVDGVLSADPRLVEGAHPLPRLAYAEAAALAAAGARILHPRTVAPLAERGIPVVVKNTLRPDSPGTWVDGRAPQPREWKAVTCRAEGASCAVTLVGASPEGGQERVRRVLERAGVRVGELRPPSPHEVSVTVDQAQGHAAVAALHRAFLEDHDPTRTGGGAVTLREPTDEPQAVHRYSCSSPSGRTSSSRSRTGRGA
jgi:bifunctional aspartokinase / homoserine dehydrogenase 1